MEEKKMAGFFKMFLRLNSNVMGFVTGSDFRNGKLPFAYIGKGEKANKGKLMIYGEKLDDYVFDKSDIASVNVTAQDCFFKGLGNKTYQGTKYEVKFNDGKSAIIQIPAANTWKFENVVY